MPLETCRKGDDAMVTYGELFQLIDIVIQIVTGLSIALLSIAGMLFYSHQEVKQQQRFRPATRN